MPRPDHSQPCILRPVVNRRSHHSICSTPGAIRTHVCVAMRRFLRNASRVVAMSNDAVLERCHDREHEVFTPWFRGYLNADG